MIIVEESQGWKSQPNHDSNDVIATSRTPLIPSESPPAYTPRENSGPSSSSTLHFNHPPPPHLPPKRRPRHATKRFAKALILAFGSYVAMIAVVKVLLFVIGAPMHNPHRGGHPRREDGTAIHCAGGGKGPPPPPHSRVQFTSFGIPLDSSAIYIVARGQQANGKITVVRDMTISGEIMVDIAAEDRDRDVFRATTICLMERKKGERGVGIFTPKDLTWSNRKTNVEITVKIPYQPASPVPEIPTFEIVAPDFQVSLQNADEFVTFRNFTIRTANIPVTIGSVKAENIDIQTSNVGIHGTFITNSSLTLSTSNAPITANIMLENGWSSGKETSDHTDVTNSSLTGAVVEASRYTIRAATTNAGLNLAFLRRPETSHSSLAPILDVVGTTSNSPADLLLQSPFEGAFDISTSRNYQAAFSSGSSSESDPLGLGRQQHIDLAKDVQWRKEGSVYWGDLDDGRQLGRVELSTSNARASLQIQ